MLATVLFVEHDVLIRQSTWTALQCSVESENAIRRRCDSADHRHDSITAADARRIGAYGFVRRPPDAGREGYETAASAFVILAESEIQPSVVSIVNNDAM
jgi:hypothetical protein